MPSAARTIGGARSKIGRKFIRKGQLLSDKFEIRKDRDIGEVRPKKFGHQKAGQYERLHTRSPPQHLHKQKRAPKTSATQRPRNPFVKTRIVRPKFVKDLLVGRLIAVGVAL